MDAWPFDLPGDPDYPVYLRGQAEEVLPGVLSPMMSTLGAPIVERAWRVHFVETFLIVDEPRAPHTFFPVFGGRSYLNLSVSARAAVLSMGVRPEDFAAQFAEGDDYVRAAAIPQAGDDVRAARVQAVTASLLADLPTDVWAAARVSASAHRAEGRARRATMTSAELLGRVRALEPEASMTLARVMLTGTLEAICFGALSQGLAGIYGEEAPELCRALLSGLGGVDSARPAQSLTALAGLDGDAYRRGLAEFLAEYGYRGAQEFEIAAPSWELVPDAVDRMVAAARSATAKSDPAVRAVDARARLEADGVAQHWPEFTSWLTNTSALVAHREAAKATFVMVYNEIRLDLVEIGKHLVARGELASPESVFLMSVEELGAAVRGDAGVERAALEQRAQQMEALARLVPPPMVRVGEVPPLDAWAVVATDGISSTTELRGVAGSAGTARGRARVVLDPYVDPPPEPGEILVAPYTDPGWTLMFMAAEAVVVEVGGALSHAVIVARELGIPAVVSVAGCCRILRTGDLVEVDGSAGVVRVLESISTGWPGSAAS